MTYFDDAIRNLNYNFGILDILVFILIFTIIFALMQKTKVLGETKDGRPMKNFNVVIALVIAAATIVPHILWSTGDPLNPRLSNGMIDVVQVIKNALPSVSLIVVAVLMFLIIIGIWGKNFEIGNSNLGGIIVVLSIIAIAFIFAVSAGWINRMPYWLENIFRDRQTITLIVVILVFGLIVKFIVGDDEDKGKKNKEDSIFKIISKENLK
jgi:hypothetical protein